MRNRGANHYCPTVVRVGEGKQTYLYPRGRERKASPSLDLTEAELSASRSNHLIFGGNRSCVQWTEV
jgi:hypothetical protein